MSNLWPRIEPLLARVEKPARYIGMERGSRQPVHRPDAAAWLLVYPDTYEIGLPNQGLQILYEILNERRDAVAERSYAPWLDLEGEMRSARVPFFSVDTHTPAGEFDIIAFNLSAELVYTNLLNCLDLGGIPVRAAARSVEDPLVLAGGHCAFNPEPLADFVDAFVIGDGEEPVGEITEVVNAWKRGGRVGGREAVLHDLSTITGVYVPSMYEVEYDGAFIRAVTPRYADVPAVVDKRTVADLADWPYPKNQLVPLIEVVHDRLNVEIFRGCTRGCRFCQAGMITRPVRERPADQVRTMVENGLQRTGYDEVALTSLSSADYSGIDTLVGDLINEQSGCGNVGLSLPSLRVDAFTVGVASQIQKVRRTGLTFAPEGGSWRIRQVINKLITEEDLYTAVDAAYSQGWRRVKLYFLVGLPTEMDEDTLGIAHLAREVVKVGRKHTKQASATVSVGGFVPKPHTPFQWFGQNGSQELKRKIWLLRDDLKRTGAQVKWHDPDATFAEGLASRGDRRIGRVIERVWRDGGTFQEWSEHFRLDRWTDAMAAEGLDPDWYVTRHRTEDEILPWDHIAAGLHKDFLWQDWQEALAEHGLPDCRWTPCYDCGVCTDYAIEHIVASPVPPAGGSQGTGQDLSTGHTVPVELVGKGNAPKVPASATRRGHVVKGDNGFPVRMRYSKRGKVRFVGHRDVARGFERAFRIVGLPLSFTLGFSPRPKVSFGLALSVGHESDAEFLDVELSEPIDLHGLPEALTAALPEGIVVTGVAALADRAPALQEAVTAVDWQLEVTTPEGVAPEPLVVARLVAAAMAAPSLRVTRTRKGREADEDIRPALRRIAVLPETEHGALLEVEVSTQPVSVRAGELLAALGGDLAERRVLRTGQWIERGGARLEPLAADPRRAVEARAS